MDFGNLPYSEGTKHQVTSASVNGEFFFFMPPLLPPEPTQDVTAGSLLGKWCWEGLNKVGKWPHSLPLLWYLILCVSLAGLRDAQIAGTHCFRLYLWCCFQKRLLAFESDWVKITLTNAWGINHLLKAWITAQKVRAGQEEKGVIEGVMVGWHHRLNGHEFQ